MRLAWHFGAPFSSARSPREAHERLLRDWASPEIYWALLFAKAANCRVSHAVESEMKPVAMLAASGWEANSLPRAQQDLFGD